MDKLYQFINILIENDFYIDVIYWSNQNLYESGYDKETEAINFFTEIAIRYPDSPNIIYEICNEPLKNTWNEVKKYADTVIPKIRENSPNSIISIPTNNNKIDDTFFNNMLEMNNILYAIHIYQSSSTTPKDISLAVKNAVPIFISEWSNINEKGTYYSNDDADSLIYVINKYHLPNSAWYFFGSNIIESDLFMIKKQYWNTLLTTGKLSDEMLGVAGKYFFDFVTGKKQEVTPPSILINYNWQTSNSLFWEEKYRTNITKIVFKNTIDIPNNAINVWDVSNSGFGSVMAYIIDDGNNSDTYELYICGNNSKVKVSSLRGTFEHFSKVKYLDISQLDTSNVTSMREFLYGNSQLENIVGLEQIDTTNVTDMWGMFGACGSITNLKLSNFNTSKVTDMTSMFYGCSRLEKLDLSNFNTLNVEKMGAMFSGTGMHSTNFELILGEDFKTSNVIDMNYMFYLTGIANKNFKLDISKFSFETVENYNNIFDLQPSTIIVYVKDTAMQQFVIDARGDNKWSTSNVIIK